MFIFGPTGDIKFANEAWYNICGLPVGTQGEKSWLSTVHPDDYGMIQDYWHKLSHEKREYTFEWRVVRNPPTGDPLKDVVSILASCYPEFDEDDNLKCISGILVDLTIQKAHEHAQAQQLSSVMEAKRQQENFQVSDSLAAS